MPILNIAIIQSSHLYVTKGAELCACPSPPFKSPNKPTPYPLPPAVSPEFPEFAVKELIKQVIQFQFIQFIAKDKRKEAHPGNAGKK